MSSNSSLSGSIACTGVTAVLSPRRPSIVPCYCERTCCCRHQHTRAGSSRAMAHRNRDLVRGVVRGTVGQQPK
jgi:hypothetical protein